MKRKNLIIDGIAFALFCGIFTAAAIQQRNNGYVSDLLLENVTALAQDENPSNWDFGKEMGEKTIVKDSVWINSPSIGGYWYYIYENIDCCVSSNSDTACYKPHQDSGC